MSVVNFGTFWSKKTWLGIRVLCVSESGCMRETLFGITNKMDYFTDDEFDSSWLTQVPSIESQKANFEVINGNMEDEENLFSAMFGEVMQTQPAVVSLEESECNNGRSVLYDNVLVEDISSDEAVDSM